MDPPSLTTHIFLDNAHMDSAWMANVTFGGSWVTRPHSSNSMYILNYFQPRWA